MTGSLSRLLRVRGLLEEQRRAELEGELGRLAAIEEDSRRAAREAGESRERWFLGIVVASVAAESEEAAQKYAEETAQRVAEEDRDFGERRRTGNNEERRPGVGWFGAESLAEQEEAERPGAGSGEGGETASSGTRREGRPLLGDGWAWIEARRPAQIERVGRARESYLAGRQERRQVEILLEAVAARQALEQARREQRDFDDWHQRQGARQSLGSKQRRPDKIEAGQRSRGGAPEGSQS